MLASFLSQKLCLASKQQLGSCCWNLLQRLQISVQVKVPPMGDSISEGSISAVLRAAGDSVRENDVIAQVETDKVTIDIKAPSDGKLIGILVKEQDTVIPGQIVATVDNAGTEGAIGQPIAAAAVPPSPEAAAAPPSPQPAAPAAAAPGRRAGIHFPPRTTPEGVRISSLSPAEAAGWLQRMTQGSGAPQPAAAAGAGAAAAAVPPPRAAAAATPAPPAAVGGTRASSGVRLTQQPSRRELTEEEMEVIMLGGASP